MKKRLYLLTVLASLAVLSLSSCLKDPRYYTFANVQPLVELPLGAANGLGNLTPEALPITSTPQTIQLVVNLASPAPLNKPVTVTLAVQQSAVDAYNTANSTSFTLLPSADYSVPSLTVTIPAGKREVIVPISINTSLVDPSGLFILPFTIVSGGGVQVSNYNSILYQVQAKNIYDGTYVVTGTLTDAANGAITGSYPETVYLETTGASTDAFYDPNIGFGHAITSGGQASYYGSYAPVFTFNGSNVVSVTNYYGQFSGSHVRSAALDPTDAPNTFTTGSPGQAGSVFQVSYYLQQGNPAVTRTTFVETFTYQGGRP